jgi:hypothetical protein
MNRSAVWTAGAMLMACVGCGGGNDAATGQQMTYEGCVQQGAGMLSNQYMLTMLNEPPEAVGTVGSVTTTGSSVERAQLQVAAQTFRLEAEENVKLQDLVGKRVRVTGAVTERANLPNGNGAVGSAEDTQRPNRNENERMDRNPQIGTADLAQLKVSNAVVTGESCGVGLGRETSVRPNAPTAGTERDPRQRR